MKIISKMVFTTVLLAASHIAAAATDYQAELVKCAAINDSASRAACFEELGRTAQIASHSEEVAEKSDVTVVADEPTTEQAQPSAMPDSIGGGKFADEAGVKPETFRGKVVRCQQASDRRWFFIFENDQVWKQVDRRKRRFRDCDFYVDMSKDAFGYTMKIDGKDTTVRVDRRR